MLLPVNDLGQGIGAGIQISGQKVECRTFCVNFINQCREVAAKTVDRAVQYLDLGYSAGFGRSTCC